MIHNAGGNDTLVGASTPAAATVEIQQRQGQTDTDAGELVTVDRARRPRLHRHPAPARRRPAAAHRPGAAPRPGDTIELTLEFERAGTVTVEAEVAAYLDIADRLLPPRLVIPGQEGVTPGQNGVTGS